MTLLLLASAVGFLISIALLVISFLGVVWSPHYQRWPATCFKIGSLGAFVTYPLLILLSNSV